MMAPEGKAVSYERGGGREEGREGGEYLGVAARAHSVADGDLHFPLRPETRRVRRNAVLPSHPCAQGTP